MPRPLYFLSFLFLGSTMAMACATGGDVLGEDDGSDGFGGDGFGGGSGGMQSTNTLTSSGTGTGTGTGMGGMGGMGTGGTGGMGTGGTGGMGCDFIHPNTCGSAIILPSVSGDEGGTQSVMGSTSGWFQIQVTEDNGSIIEEDLKYTATLNVPPGMDYDLIIHPGPDDGPPNCNATPLTAPNGPTEVIKQEWDDSQGIGGETDDKWLSIEVRHISGDDCFAEWTLTVQGDV